VRLSVLAPLNPLAVHAEDLKAGWEAGIAEPDVELLRPTELLSMFRAATIDVIYG